LETNFFEKVGEITPEIAQQIERKSGDIILEYGTANWGLKYMQAKHSKEYLQINMTAVEYVAFVCNYFNQIRYDEIDYPNSLILVYKNGLAKVIYIQMSFNIQGNYWSVSSGNPLQYMRLGKNTKLLWERIAPCSS